MDASGAWDNQGMLELKSLASPVEIRGRGWLYPVAAPRGVNPREWRGREATLDGQRVSILGVETFAAPDELVRRSDWPAGVLVRDRLAGD
jgi:hypothetical protein